MTFLAGAKYSWMFSGMTGFSFSGARGTFAADGFKGRALDRLPTGTGPFRGASARTRVLLLDRRSTPARMVDRI